MQKAIDIVKYVFFCDTGIELSGKALHGSGVAIGMGMVTIAVVRKPISQVHQAALTEWGVAVAGATTAATALLLIAVTPNG